ncbi:MAG: UvrD-helicase domain-containing protein [Mariniblastus sp.]|nr:UvrD-helicase domain-containing protein [Mariniblastus sp.]
MSPTGVPSFSNDLIRASAGTGKTFALSNRYLQLLASGVSCESILATTFTRKGAGEILDRIIQRLSRAALDSEKAKELSEQIEYALDSSRAQKILADLIRNLHRLQIGTLDSFFHRIAQSFTFELDLPETWAIVQEQQINLLRDAAIQDILRNRSVLQLVRLMNKGEAQRRVADLIRQTVQSIYWVYRESEPDAWKKIPACETFLARDQIEAIVTELQSIEVEQYPDKRQKKQFDKDVHHILNQDWEELIKTKLFLQMFEQEPSYYKKPLPPRFVELYLKLIPHCRAHVIKRLIQQNESTYDLLDQYSGRFERVQTDAGELRFQDITNRLVTYVAGLEARDMGFRLDHQINHLLLDEFQDTSPAQWSVIKPFAVQTTQQEGERSFFCVGDAKQAIYGWRGGVAEIFDLVSQELSNVDDGKKLTTSYRSSPIVMDLVNQVFEGLDQLESDKPFVEKAARDWAARFEHHRTARQELDGYVTLERAPEGSGGPKSKTKSKERNDEVLNRAVELVREIAEQHAGDDTLTVGVLVRKNVTVGELIFRLQQAGVEASEEGGNPLTDSAAVELVLSAMQLADHPSDSIARFHLSHSPLASRFGLLPETPENQSVNAQSAVLSADSVRQDLLVQGFGPTVEGMAVKLVDQCTSRELMRLQQLVQEAFNYDQQVRGERSRLRADQFVFYIRKEFRAHDQSSARIRVMTIHQAKGLEFDIVILPFQGSPSGWLTQRPEVVVDRDRPTDGVAVACRWVSEQERLFLPESFQRMHERDRERVVRESLSVLYVALTRAAHAVHVVIPRGAKRSDVSDEGVLLAMLQPESGEVESAEGVIYQHGNPNWFLEDRSHNLDPTDDSSHEFYLPEGAKLKPVDLKSGVGSGRGMRRTTPSSLEGGSEVALADLFVSQDDQDRLLQGSLMHRCLEQITWIEDYEMNSGLLRSLLYPLNPRGDWIDVCLQEFERFLESEAVDPLLSQVSYRQEILPQMILDSDTHAHELRLEIQTERAFAVFLDGELVRGVIDRLVLIRDGANLVAADLIDYKTDRVAAEHLDGRVEYYRPQLNAYRLAVSHFCHLPIEKVAARLLFVKSGVSVDVPMNEQDMKRWTATSYNMIQPTQAHDANVESDKSTAAVSLPLQSSPSKSISEKQTHPHVGNEKENQSPQPGQQLNLWEEE